MIFVYVTNHMENSTNKFSYHPLCLDLRSKQVTEMIFKSFEG